MTVRLLDQVDKELDAGKGSANLEQPLNAVLWLIKDLKASGIELKKGDLLSLGAFSRLLPPKPVTGAKVVYDGLPGTPSVSMRFKLRARCAQPARGGGAASPHCCLRSTSGRQVVSPLNRP